MSLSKVTKKIVEILKSNGDVYDIFGDNIYREEITNDDPKLTPWCCVYKGRRDFNWRVLGNRSMQNTSEVKIILQASHLGSTVETSDLLEDYVAKVIKALRNANSNLSGVVDMINSFSVEFFFSETEYDSMYFQAAEITMEIELDEYES